MSSMWVLYLISHSLSARRKKNMTLLFSTLSIAAGVLSLTVVIGVMNGLQDALIKNLIHIESYEYSGVVKEGLSVSALEDKVKEIQSISGVEVVVPFVDEFALISNNKISALAHVRAVLSEAAYNDTEFISAIGGDISKSEDAGAFVQRGSIRLGWALAAQLGVYQGDVVRLLLPGSGEGFTPNTQTLVVSNIFFTASSYDSTWAFISLADYAQSMVPTADVLSSVPAQYTKGPNLTGLRFGLRMKNHAASMQSVQGLLENVRSWQENNLSFYFALKTEKTLLALLAAIIFAVIALHFRFAMLRRINGKRDDIVSLCAMGATPQNIRMWFVGEGAFMGVLGIAGGLTLGLSMFALYPYLVGLLQNTSSLMPMLANTELGFVRIGEVAMIIVCAAIILLASAYFAARRVTNISPMQILHYE